MSHFFQKSDVGGNIDCLFPPEKSIESSDPSSINASFTTLKTLSPQIRDVPKQQTTRQVPVCDEPIEAGHADNVSNPLFNSKTSHDQTVSVLPELESPAINAPTTAHAQDGETQNSETAICREDTFRTNDGLDPNSINVAFIISKLAHTPISEFPIQQTTLQTLDCGESLEAGCIDDEPNHVPNGKTPYDCSIHVAQELDCPATNDDDNGAEIAATYVVDEPATYVLEQNTEEMGSFVLEYSKAESSIPAIIFHDRHEAPREMGSMVTHAESIEYSYSKDSDKSGSGGLGSSNDDDVGNLPQTHDNLGRTLQTAHVNGTTVETIEEDEDKEVEI